MAVPLTSSSKRCCRSGTTDSRIIPPKPSTVPMRVRSAMIGPGTPLAMRCLDWATLG